MGEAGIVCAVLNARNDEHEAAVVAEAGQPGTVTISTNMAGRGTDIRLGGADSRRHGEVAALGGLYVIGTNRHESLRIDRQLRGRAGRQGDPGQTRFFISIEDDLFEHYGLTKIFRERHRIEPGEGEIGTAAMRREVEHAQRVIEGQNFDIRRQLARYSSLVELQRKVVQARRDALLLGLPDGPEDDVWPLGRLRERDPETWRRAEDRLGSAAAADLERRVALYLLDRAWSDHLAWVQDTRESIHLVSLGGKTPIDEFRRQATEVFLELRGRIAEAVADEVEAILSPGVDPAAALERLKGPSSTWTYLVNEDQFGWGMELIKGKNIGSIAIAGAVYGPLLVLTLLVRRFFRRKPKTPPA